VSDPFGMIHERVRQARIERNLSQVSLGALAGVFLERVRPLETRGKGTLQTLDWVVARSEPRATDYRRRAALKTHAS
jgi:hypothetical protein